MESTLSRKRKLSILLLSLLLHIALFLMLFISLTDPQTRKKLLQKRRIELVEKLKKMPKKQRWAATQTRASQLGAPVMFQSLPEPQQAPSTTQKTTQSIAQKTAENIQKETQSVAPDTLQKIVVQQKTIEKKQELTKKEENIKPIDEVKPEQNILTTQHELIETTPDQTTAIAMPNKEQPQELQEQKSAVEKLIKRTEIKEEALQKSTAIAYTQKTQEESHKIVKLKQKQVKQQQISPQKKVTLAQITKGFLEQIKNNGQQAVKMRGDKDRLPTDEQLKHERYLQRLQWCLQNSMKIHQRKYVLKEPLRRKTSLDVYVALNRNGHISELSLLRSSGIQLIDDFVLFSFKDASDGFPPVPQFFKKEPYTIVFTVKMYDTPQPIFRLHMQ